MSQGSGCAGAHALGRVLRRSEGVHRGGTPLLLPLPQATFFSGACVWAPWLPRIIKAYLKISCCMHGRTLHLRIYWQACRQGNQL